MTEHRIYLYSLWVRIWHWTNALLFLVLILTGASMHYAGEGGFLIPFGAAVALHNFAGVTLTLLYLIFFVANGVSGNYKHYVPSPRGMFSRLFLQTKYYLFGIFKGEPHPTRATQALKFNPLQQITYLGIMYGLVPLIIVTGWLLLFPEEAPDKIMGAGGIWPIAVGHTVLGFFGAVFMVGHIYLGTTGHTPAANFRGMWNGRHENE